jgi:hypothetical protein
MKKPIDVLDLTRTAIRAYGADGLCNSELDCGCSANQLAPCGDGPYHDCCLAMTLIIPEKDADGSFKELFHPQTREQIFYDADPGDIIYVAKIFDTSGDSQ